MSTHAPDWEDQRAFLAVMEHGSLSGASRALHVAQPTIRRRVEALESALGTVLFTRAPNGLVPTEEARALAPHARAMAIASEAFSRAATAPAGVIAGTVRIGAADVVGVEVLPPMLATLRERHPALIFELSLSNYAEDLLSREVDIAVRMVRPSQAAVVARRVGRVELGFHAHRNYITRRGMPESLNALVGHDLIGPDRDPMDLGTLERLGGGLGREIFTLRSDNHLAHLAALRAGLGIGLIHMALAARDPDLVPVLPGAVNFGFDTWIAMHEDLRRVARVRAVFDHLVHGMTAYAEGKA